MLLNEVASSREILADPSGAKLKSPMSIRECMSGHLIHSSLASLILLMRARVDLDVKPKLWTKKRDTDFVEGPGRGTNPCDMGAQGPTWGKRWT